MNRLNLTTPTLSKPTTRHGARHHIFTTDLPVHRRTHRLLPDKRAIAKVKFDNMEALAIVRRSSSSWSSLLHLEPKPNRGRSYRDYCRLNAHITPDHYLTLHIQDFSAQLAGCSVFSKVDIIRGYHQIPVQDGNVPKTAVTTPCGLYVHPSA